MMDSDLINRVQAVSKEIQPQWITIKSRKDGCYQTFKAKDLESWINGSKLKGYKYCTFRSNNPYIFFFSKDGIQLNQDRVYLTTDLPVFDTVGAEYYEGITDDDIITVYYSNAWWEQCLNWKEVKAKIKRDGNRED